MRLTEKIKSWCVEHASVAKDADDDTFRKALANALANGDMEVDTYKELSTTEKETEAVTFVMRLEDLGAKLDRLAGSAAEQATEKETKTTTKSGERKPTDEKEVGWFSRLIGDMRDDDDGQSRVKGAWEQYSSTKTALLYPAQTKRGMPHPLAGQQVIDFEGSRGAAHPVDKASDLERAICGSYFKWLVASDRFRSKRIGFNELPQHDKELLLYGMEKLNWTVWQKDSDITDHLSIRLTKALIDDATSGGLEAAPIVFDEMVIEAPLLSGELFPLVNTIPLDRGRRVEGVSVGKVTASWGGVDDTAITLFTTTGFVTAFDTTIYRWEGSIQIGLDFMSDTPIDFGSLVTRQYGERLMEDLDDVIAVGNGSTQPEGVMTKSGTTSVNFGATTPTVGGYEQLLFAVQKQERLGTLRNTGVFCSNEVSYRRARAIPVGASDERRIFGMTHEDYMLLNRPYKINHSMTNSQGFFAVLGRYRMYRRRGLTIRTSTEGDTLIRKNLMLVVATSRWGGALERGACAAVSTNMQA